MSEEEEGMDGLIGIDPSELQVSFMPSGTSFQQQLLEGVDFPGKLRKILWAVDRETPFAFLTPDLIDLHAKTTVSVLDLKFMQQRFPESGIAKFAGEEMLKNNAELKTITKASRANNGFTTSMNRTEISKQEVKHKITDDRPSKFPWKAKGEEE